MYVFPSLPPCNILVALAIRRLCLANLISLFTAIFLFPILCVNHSCLVDKGFWRQGSATYAALCPTVSAMATRGNRSGSLQDGAIVPSDLLTSQKGTPLLVHPMLHPNIGSPRDAATLGDNNGYSRGYRLCLPCHPCFATTVSVFYLVLVATQHGGICIVVTHKISSSVAKHPDCHCWYR